MRILMMHKNDEQSEAGVAPDMELVKNMGAFVGRFMESGQLVDGAGLLGSSHRTRMTFKNGEASIKHGPYQGTFEVPTELLLLEVKTREEAIGWGERYGKILGNGEIELGKVTEPWDLGIGTAPENAPLHIMLVDKADKETEAGGRSSATKAALSRLKTEMIKAGVLQKAHALAPSKDAKRLNFTSNNLKVTDGPFIESKELLGGYVIIDLASVDEAIELAKEYAQILGGTLESELRIVESSDNV